VAYPATQPAQNSSPIFLNITVPLFFVIDYLMPQEWDCMQHALSSRSTIIVYWQLSSLPDLKEISCKSVWTVHISPLFRPIEQLLTFIIVKICPRPVTFSL
jgi:hypothetical protein